MKSSLMAVLAISLTACSPAPNSARWPEGPPIDLSHDYSDQTVFWPTAESFKLDKVADGVTEQGYYYAANNFSTSEHGGTRQSTRLSGDDRGFHRVGTIERRDPGRHDCLDSYRILALLARRVAIPWDGRTRYRRRRQAALSRVAPRRSPVAGGVAPGQVGRPRHGQHRLRAVDDVRVAPHALRARHSSVRESDQSRSLAGHRSVRRRAAHEDQGRKRSAAAGCCLRAANVKVSPSPRLTAEIAESAAELEATAVVQRERPGCA